MTLDEARVFAKEVVAEHGPDAAKEILWQRCLVDADFHELMIFHGVTIADAMIQSNTATRH